VIAIDHHCVLLAGRAAVGIGLALFPLSLYLVRVKLLKLALELVLS